MRMPPTLTQRAICGGPYHAEAAGRVACLAHCRLLRWSAPWRAAVGPGEYRSPRHSVPFDPRDKGSKGNG